MSKIVQASERFLEIKGQNNHGRKDGPKFIKRLTILNKTITITEARDEFGKVIACKTWVYKALDDREVTYCTVQSWVGSV